MSGAYGPERIRSELLTRGDRPMPSRYPTTMDIAATLRTIAARLDDITTASVRSYVHISLQPENDADPADSAGRVAAVDAIGEAVLGYPGTYRADISHHQAAGYVGVVKFEVFNTVDNPEKVALQREIEELRRQRDELAAVEAIRAGTGGPVIQARRVPASESNWHAGAAAIPYVPDPDPLPGQHSIPHSVDPYELAAGDQVDGDEDTGTGER